jgi:TP901 family phage tail tape measure protein
MQNVNIVFNANANFGDLVAEVRRVNAELAGLNTQMMGLDARGRSSVIRFNRDFAETLKLSGQFDTSIVTASSNIESFGKNLDAGRLRLKDYYRAWKTSASSAQGEVRKLAEQQVRLERSIVKQTGVDGRGRAVMSVFTPRGLDLTKTEVVSAVNQKRVQIFNEMIKKGSTELINWGKNTQWAGRQLTVGLTVPMTIFAGTAATAFKNADEQLTRLAKVYGDVGGATQQQIALIKTQAMDLAKTLAADLGAPLEQTLGLAADIAATGQMGDELIKATAETTRLAVLGEVDRQQALETTLSLQNAFNLSTQELTESINFLNSVENQTSTSLQDLTVAIPKAGPVIKSLGGDVKDLALFLSAMVEGGVSAGEAANAIKSGFASLINPTKQTVDVMSRFGISINNIVEGNAGDLVGTIMALKEAIDGLDPLSKTRALEQLFGKYQVSRITALFDNIGAAGSQTVEVMKLMEASTADLAAAADRELEVLTQSASGKFNRQIARLKANMADIGEGFIPAFTMALDLINKLIEGFSNLPGPVKNILNILGGLVAIAGPIIMLAGVFGNFFGYLIKGLGVVRRFITGTKGFQLVTADTIAMRAAAEGATNAIYDEAVAMGVLRSAANSLTRELGTLISRQNTLASGAVRGRSNIVTRRGFNKGVFKVPGEGNSDTVPAMLTPGESVIPKDMTQRYGPLINAMIKGEIPGYETGLEAIISRYVSQGLIAQPASRTMAGLQRRYEQDPQTLMRGLESFISTQRTLNQSQGNMNDEIKLTIKSLRSYLPSSRNQLSHLSMPTTYQDLMGRGDVAGAQSFRSNLMTSLRVGPDRIDQYLPFFGGLGNLVGELPDYANQQLRTGNISGAALSTHINPSTFFRSGALGGLDLDNTENRAALQSFSRRFQSELLDIGNVNIDDMRVAQLIDRLLIETRQLGGAATTAADSLIKAKASLHSFRVINPSTSGGSLSQQLGNLPIQNPDLFEKGPGGQIIIPGSGTEVGRLRSEGRGAGYTPGTLFTPGMKGYTSSVQIPQAIGMEIVDEFERNLIIGARMATKSKSPSREFMNVGHDAGVGGVIGFKQGVNDLTPQAAVAGRNLANAFVMGQAGDLGISTLPPGPRSDIRTRELIPADENVNPGMLSGRRGKFMGLGMAAGVGSMAAFSAGQAGIGSALGMLGMIDMLSYFDKISVSTIAKFSLLTSAVALLAGVTMQAYRNTQSMNASFINSEGVAQEFGISIDNLADSITNVGEKSVEAKDELEALRESLLQDDEFNKLVDRLSKPNLMQTLFLKTNLSNEEALEEAQIQVQTLISAGFESEDAKKIMRILLEESGRAGLFIGLDFDMTKSEALSQLIQDFEDGNENAKNVAKSVNDFLADLVTASNSSKDINNALLEVGKVVGMNNVVFAQLKSQILDAKNGLEETDPAMFSLINSAKNMTDLFLLTEASSMGIASNLIFAAKNASTLGQLVKSFADLPQTVKDILGPRPSAERSSAKVATNYDNQLKSIDAQIDALKEKERVEENINKLKELQIEHERSLQDLSVNLSQALAGGDLAEAARIMGQITNEEEDYRREYSKTQREIKREDEVARLERLKAALQDAKDSATEATQSIANKAQEAYDKASTAITDFIKNNNGVMFSSIDELKRKMGPELLQIIENTGKNVSQVLAGVQKEINENFSFTSGLDKEEFARYQQLLQTRSNRRLGTSEFRELNRLQGEINKSRDTSASTAVSTQNMQVQAQSVTLSVGTITTPTVKVVTTTGQLGRANGGYISGPGGPKSDIIPAMLSNGEFVINAAAVKKYGLGMMNQINSQRFGMGGLAMPKYGMGGSVAKYGGGGYVAKYAEGGMVTSSNNVTYNVNMSINNPGASAEEIWTLFQSKMEQEKRRMGKNKKVVY